MFYVRFNTHVTDHPRFAEAGPQARDLWTWGMLYAGKHETDGDLPMSAVLASPWGHGGKANAKAAAKLVDVGLWERTDRGFRICRWSDQGNKTRAELEENREKERAKKAADREKKKPVPQGQPKGHPEGLPKESLTINSSESSGSLSSAENKILTGSAGAAPDWFAVDAVEMVRMNAGFDVDQIGARWLEYSASRKRKTWTMNAQDAAGWITTVIRSERREADARPKTKGAEATKQPYDENAPWMKLPEVG